MSDRTPLPPNPPSTRIIGLTGGVGMGKTTISNYLKTVHHLPVLDADIYAREAVEPGSAVLREIVERYGSSILRPDGTLDRLRVGEIVFNSPAERLWLEQRIHPFVRDRMETELKTLIAQVCPIIVLVIPLLFEARMTDLVTEIWVVYCSADEQVERLLQRQVEGLTNREFLTLEQIHARINSQMAIEKKVQQANVILDNSSTQEYLWEQVDRALMRSVNSSPDRSATPDTD